VVDAGHEQRWAAQQGGKPEWTVGEHGLIAKEAGRVQGARSL